MGNSDTSPRWHQRYRPAPATPRVRRTRRRPQRGRSGRREVDALYGRFPEGGTDFGFLSGAPRLRANRDPTGPGRPDCTPMVRRSATRASNTLSTVQFPAGLETTSQWRAVGGDFDRRPPLQTKIPLERTV